MRLVATAAAVLIVGVAVAFGVAQLGEDEDDARTLAATVDRAMPEAGGRLEIADDAATLHLHDMPDLGGTRVYQVWLQHDDRMVPGPHLRGRGERRGRRGAARSAQRRRCLRDARGARRREGAQRGSDCERASVARVSAQPWRSVTATRIARPACAARTASGPICPDCMTSTPVGMRCPECARQSTKVRTMRSIDGRALAHLLPRRAQRARGAGLAVRRRRRRLHRAPASSATAACRRPRSARASCGGSSRAASSTAGSSTCSRTCSRSTSSASWSSPRSAACASGSSTSCRSCAAPSARSCCRRTASPWARRAPCSA